MIPESEITQMSNMLTALEKSIKEPLAQEQIRKILRDIHLILNFQFALLERFTK